MNFKRNFQWNSTKILKVSDTQLKENMQENKWTSMTNSVQTALKAVLRQERECYNPTFTTLTVRGYILLW